MWFNSSTDKNRNSAYKQRFQWLQLEATAPRRVPTIVPVFLPWVLRRGKRVRKRWNKGSRCGQGRRKQGKKNDVGKNAGVFAVGAGLLLGWTVGWIYSRAEPIEDCRLLMQMLKGMQPLLSNLFE